MDMERLKKQIDFLIEIDKLKTVLRRAYIADASRRENSAEHSWHMAMMAMTLAEHGPDGLDVNRVIKMVLIHDVAEIDAGDTSVYLRASDPGIADREKLAAKRIFGLLPLEQAQELLELQSEFDERKTSESRFAGALDRLMPLVHNYATKGRRWREDGITYEQVYAVNQTVREGSQELWEYACSLINECVEKGYLQKGVG
ncbi:MAG: phosphohydrolase [Chloroflexi bacterium RBG_16_57_8]|nr:MAG: phosphohydrolase [Chloroflexi bacterium RBG_16_57_8]